MLPAANKGLSQSFGFPDTCLTPPVGEPIPYPNVAMHAQAATFSPIVSVFMIPALNQASVIQKTTGDEPGRLHWTQMGPGTFDVGNPIVSIHMIPAVHLTTPTDGNTGNDSVGCVVAPGAPNVLYTLAPDAAEHSRFITPLGGARSISRDQQAAMAGRLSGPPLDGEPQLLPGGVGLIRVNAFSLALPGALHLAIERLASRGMGALLLDLRDCPGGEWAALVAVAADFLEPGSLIATLHDADGDETPYLARGGQPHRLPMILLVNERTASAAELFAGVLQAHRRAAVIGARTHGKGVAQALFPAQGGAGAALGSVADILLPDGVSITGVGVAPDIEAPAEGAAQQAISLCRSLLCSVRDGAASGPIPRASSKPSGEHSPSRETGAS